MKLFTTGQPVLRTGCCSYKETFWRRDTYVWQHITNKNQSTVWTCRRQLLFTTSPHCLGLLSWEENGRKEGCKLILSVHTSKICWWPCWGIAAPNHQYLAHGWAKLGGNSWILVYLYQVAAQFLGKFYSFSEIKDNHPSPQPNQLPVNPS